MTIILPGGSRRELPAGEKLVLLDRTEEAGNYQVSADNEVSVFSVNVDPGEASFTRVSPPMPDKASPATTLSGNEELRTWLGRSRGYVPLWPYLLGAALLIFLAEGAFSNLTAARRAQGDSAGVRTGRLNQRRAGTPFRSEESSPRTGAST